MVLAEPLQIAIQIAEVLQDLNIQYMVGGSLASSLYGIPRTTQDIDIVADIKMEQVPIVTNLLKNDFFIDKDLFRKSLSMKSSFNMIHLKSMFKVDIFFMKNEEAAVEEMSRRKRFDVSEEKTHNIFLSSAEDIVVHKLYWYQLGEMVSDRQWNDALGVLKVQGENLDYDYLKKAADRMNVSDLLSKALEDSK